MKAKIKYRFFFAFWGELLYAGFATRRLHEWTFNRS